MVEPRPELIGNGGAHRRLRLGAIRRGSRHVEQLAVEARVAPRRAPHRTRRARRSASNTGCTSVGELLMTRRISAVAVCRSSASCVSLNSRTFSIAITAWSAKVCEQLDLVRREWPGLAPGDVTCRSRRCRAAAGHGRPCCGSRAPRATAALPAPMRLRASVSVTSTVSPAAIRCPNWKRSSADPRQRRKAASPSGVVGVNADQVHRLVAEAQTAVEQPPSSRFELAAIASNTGCTSVGRSGDDLAGSRRSPSALQRLLGLVEQAHVLDGDHRLVGEGLDQLDLARRMCCRRSAPADQYRAHACRPCASGAHHRRAATAGVSADVRRLSGVGERPVVDAPSSCLDDRPRRAVGARIDRDILRPCSRPVARPCWSAPSRAVVRYFAARRAEQRSRATTDRTRTAGRDRRRRSLMNAGCTSLSAIW